MISGRATFFLPTITPARQLVYGATGIMMVETQQGRWVVPPDRAVWIPGGMRHNLRMLSDVTTITIWVEPNRRWHLPEHCQVVEISPLMRSLLTAAIDVEPEYDRNGRDGSLMSLLLHELVRLPPLPLSLNFPTARRAGGALPRVSQQSRPARYDRGLERCARHEPSHIHPPVPRARRA